MKLGIVFEGGASRTYFSTGVMDVLLEQKIYADYVIGVSAGIANGVSYVSRQIGRNIEIGERFVHDRRYMGLHHLLDPRKRSYYNVDFVFREIPERYIPFDHDAFAASGCETIATVTNIETGEAEYMPVEPYDREWKQLIASCSLPVLFQPTEIDGKLYLDGGIADSIPVERAMKDGCDKIIVVTTRERSYRKTKETGIAISSLIYRKYPKLVERLKSRAGEYNSSRDHLAVLEREGKLFLIAPEDTSGWGRTESASEKLRAMHEIGRATAEKLMPQLCAYLES